MKNLAPDIVRQRLLIEGYYTRDVDEASISEYLMGIAAHLGLQSYGEPTIHSPSGIGKEDNAGFDAFLPLIDSGISLYVWESKQFFAAVLFTCKAFDEEAAIEYSRTFFAAPEMEHQAF